MGETVFIAREDQGSGTERPRHRRGQRKLQARLRAMRCVAGVLEGLTFQEVADREGYASRGTVHRIVQQTLAQHEVEGIEELRALELARLDGIQAAFYKETVAGDVKAAEVVLKVIAARTRLLQLDRVVTSEPAIPDNVVVVGGATEEYVAALRSGRDQ